MGREERAHPPLTQAVAPGGRDFLFRPWTNVHNSHRREPGIRTRKPQFLRLRALPISVSSPRLPDLPPAEGQRNPEGRKLVHQVAETIESFFTRRRASCTRQDSNLPCQRPQRCASSSWATSACTREDSNLQHLPPEDSASTLGPRVRKTGTFDDHHAMGPRSAAPAGLEPATRGLKIPCSTN